MRVLVIMLLLMAMPVMAFAGGNNEDGNAADQAVLVADLDAARAAQLDANAPAENTAVKAETAIAADTTVAVDLAEGGAAGSVYETCGLKMPCTCQITCVNVAIACCCDPCACGPTGSNGTVKVEFLGADGAVLGTADVEGPWCNPCDNCDRVAQLDKPVNPQDVCSAKVSWVGDGGVNVKMIVIRVLNEDPCGCGCGKWSKVFKCSPDCCQILDGNTPWVISSGGSCGCGCGSKCGSGCKSSCGSKCGGDKCGCKSKCGGDKCGCKSKCGGDKCGCKSKCGGDKCGCKSKCGGDKCGSSCGCGKCR